MEILVSLVLVTLIAGGTLIGFMLAGRVSQESVTGTQSAAEATQTLEVFRNMIACRQPGEAADQTWFGPNCEDARPTGTQGHVMAWAGSYSPFLAGATDLADSSSRKYTVTPVEVDASHPGPEAYAVTVRVHGDEPQ